MILGKSLAHTAALYPDKPAIVDDGHVWTHRELQARVYRLANALTDLGFDRGSRIAVLARNSHRYLEISFALALNGICMVPINHRLRPAEIDYRLKHAEVSAWFVEREFLDLVGDGEQSMGASIEGRTIIVDGSGDGCLGYEALIEQGDVGQPKVSVDPEDPLYLGYTSGTTGRSKAAIISHRAIVVGFLYKTLQYGLHADDVTLNPGFFWHSAPRDFALLQIYLGGTTVVMRDFRPEECLALIERHKVTNGFYVPTMMRMMLEQDSLGTFDLGSLRLLISGGAPLPTPLKNDILERFGAILHEFYGATETRIVSSITPAELERKTRSVGRVERDIEVRILDDQGQELPIGETGEIFLRTPTLFSGYYNDPAKTKAAFRGEWFTLGDMGRVDDDGYLYLVDRRDDMVISGGENIYPSEVEDVLLRHPAVSDVAVIGVPDPNWGEALKAVVCVRDGATVTPKELTAFCADHLADYLKPRSYDFVDELPRNPTGKILKRELREPYWRGSEARV